MKKLLVVLISLLIPLYGFCAAPTFTGIAGTTEIIVSGANYVNNPSYENNSNMDDWSETITYNEYQGATATGTDGNISWYSDVSALDAAACVANGVNAFQIIKDASNYSTGYGLRQGVALNTIGTGAVMNWSWKFDLATPSTDEVWYRFYVKMDSITPPGTYAPTTHKIAFLWYNRATGVGAARTFVPGMSRLGGAFQATNQSIDAVFSYSEDDVPTMDSFPGTDVWFEFTVYHKLNTFISTVDQGGGELKMWLNGDLIFDYANEVPLSADRSLASEVNALIDRIEFGGNISGGTQNWLAANQAGYRSFDDFAISRTEKPKSIPCVYLSNNSTWGVGVTDRWNGDANFVRQKVGGTAQLDQGFNSWSNTEILFQKDTTGLSGDTYLYVTNWDGDTNVSGFLISETPATSVGIMNGTVNGNFR